MTPSPISYARRPIALLTQHGKEQVLARVLDAALGCRVTHVTGYDTDQLGTFTRDIPRPGTQREAARRKARLGMELAGLPHGLASEGAFGADPYAGMLPWNVEMLLFIDDELGLEVVGLAQGAAKSGHLLSADWEEVEGFARSQGFPRHHLVVRPEGEFDPRLRKGIADWTMLHEAFEEARSRAANRLVFVESDLRAHANPTRMEMIGLAAEDLVRKLAATCPACGVPGFGRVERTLGRPCGDCGAPTREPRAEVHGCLRCNHRETHPVPGPAYADPGSCDLCNP